MQLHDRSTRRLAVLGALSALTVGALAFPALADSVTDDPSEEVTDETTQQPARAGGDQSDDFPDVPRQVQGMREGFVEALAEELDLPVDTVTDAIEAASERLANQWEEERLTHLRERLDDAVADGDLTREQADAIIAAAEAGVLPFGSGLRQGPGMGLRNAPEMPRMHGPPLWDDVHDDTPDTGTEGS